MYDIRNHFGFFDLLPPCLHLGLICTTLFTQPPSLHLLHGDPPSYCGRHVRSVPGVILALPIEREPVVHVTHGEADASVVGTIDADGGEVVVVLQFGVTVSVAGVQRIDLVDGGQ